MNITQTAKIDLAQFGTLFKTDPTNLSDQELLSLDFLLHRVAAIASEEHPVFLEGEGWTHQDVVRLHDKVREEMAARGYRHTIEDPLTAESSTPEPQKDLIQPLFTLSGDAAEVEDETEKGVRQAFGSYGGKRLLAHKIAAYIPYHKTYVEPFAGGAAVLFAKAPSPKEVLNDRDPEIAFMHRFIRDHSPEDRAALSRREWTIRKSVHERLRDLKPADDRERFYKGYYLTRSSYGKMRGKSFNPANEGVRIDFPANIERAQKRIQTTAVHNKDYLKVLRKYDGPETFFYIDPPYPGTFNLFDFGFKEDQFVEALSRLKAKWIVSYPEERKSALKKYNVMTVKRRNQMKGPGGNQEWVKEILASNHPFEAVHLYVDKALGPLSTV
ncbi:MAG: hypothetical protein A2992_06400 [Elusimicrobia bacterium RIFCSPLOWO2_01_FULL_59_12]|nr:MAG: hypothetical protein A2992_06400 [Elusimicrobia bacterium RIFCSPLOWO2_01_FULL_59_12]